MPFELASLADLANARFDDIIDVRSPSEFAEDHIPGAVNLPVLDDAERARVGTIYTKDSRFRARRLGAALVARNAARHLDGYLADKGPRYRPLVHCWRGGQRSGAFAAILGQIGWRVETLDGGYRAYRRQVVAMLYDEPFPAPVVLLDGYTGTAKTELLCMLAARGAQVIDLEGLARHRGSLFGAMTGGQPTQKSFESALATQITALDPERPVLIEAESSSIGDVLVPPALWQAMRAAPRLEVTAPPGARAAYLARTYADLTTDRERLAAVIDRLRPYHAAGLVEQWHALAAEGAFEALAADLMARHYDPRYLRSAARRACPPACVAEVEALDPAGLERLADDLIRHLGDLEPKASEMVPRPERIHR
jgi:tRNA 2-selenouridine synthase